MWYIGKRTKIRVPGLFNASWCSRGFGCVMWSCVLVCVPVSFCVFPFFFCRYGTVQKPQSFWCVSVSWSLGCSQILGVFSSSWSTCISLLYSQSTIPSITTPIIYSFFVHHHDDIDNNNTVGTPSSPISLLVWSSRSQWLSRTGETLCRKCPNFGGLVPFHEKSMVQRASSTATRQL